MRDNDMPANRILSVLPNSRGQHQLQLETCTAINKLDYSVPVHSEKKI